jgi:hypothetical protein
MNNLFYGMVISRIKKALEDSNVATNYDNQVLKGRAREIFISDLLVPFLDKSFGVCSGIIIDSKNKHSKQIDIIVYDTKIVQPIMLTSGEGVIPYEAVLGTIEVKSRLDNTELKKSVHNARSIKFLKFDRFEILKPICKACIDKTDVEPNLQSPVCFVFAFSSSLSKGSESLRLNNCVRKINNESGKEVTLPISALCVADKCFTYCTNMNSKPPTFTEIRKDKENNTLEFILNVINSCNIRSAEREKIYLDRYLK